MLPYRNDDRRATARSPARMASASSPPAGYTIVEIAIVLVVLGLLIGGSLLPLGERMRTVNEVSERAALAEIKELITGYAVRHRTQQRTLHVGSVEHPIAPHRPYLPCPDIDNDGIEDRVAVSHPVVPLTYTNLSTMGACSAQKGLLPWRTLGAPQVDRWGNRYTYFVDLAYSNEVLGFDETYRADIYDYTAELQTHATGFRYADRTTNEQPGIVCVSLHCDPTLVEPEDLIAGDVAAAATTTEPFTYVANDIVDGVAFLVLSHGRNGAGAVSRDGTCKTELPIGEGEEENAHYPTGSSLPSSDASCNALRNYTSAVTGVDYRLNQFVSYPRGLDVGTGITLNFDDILAWVSPDSLVGDLAQAGVFPVPRNDTFLITP